MITLITINNGRHSASSSSFTESEDEGFSENNNHNNSFMAMTIKGPTGSVRGIKHCVRQNVQNFNDKMDNNMVSCLVKSEV